MKRAMGFIVAVAGVLVGGAALAHDGPSAPGADAGGVYHACVDRLGFMRLVGGPSECRREESPIAWSLAGPAGATGAPGAAGAVGATGAVGPMGPIGMTGPAGAMGPVGAMGPMGLAGATGAMGASGAQGAAGAPGPMGLQGPMGLAGATGATGAAGAPGAMGPPGPPGANGPEGPAGPATVVAEAELVAPLEDSPKDSFMTVLDANGNEISGDITVPGYEHTFHVSAGGLAIARRDDGSLRWSHFSVQVPYASDVSALVAAASNHAALVSVEIALTKRAEGGPLFEFERITLSNVTVASAGAISTGLSGTDTVVPMITLELDFQKFELQYRERMLDGAAGAIAIVSYDRAADATVHAPAAAFGFEMSGPMVPTGALTVSSVNSYSQGAVARGAALGGSAVGGTNLPTVKHFDALLHQQPVTTLTTAAYKNIAATTPFISQAYANATFTSISLGLATETVTWRAPSMTLTTTASDGSSLTTPLP